MKAIRTYIPNLSQKLRIRVFERQFPSPVRRKTRCITAFRGRFRDVTTRRDNAREDQFKQTAIKFHTYRASVSSRHWYTESIASSSRGRSINHVRFTQLSDTHYSRSHLSSMHVDFRSFFRLLLSSPTTFAIGSSSDNLILF